MTLLYQLIPAEGAKPRGKMPQGAQQARADAECGEEDMHSGRTRCKACPARPARGPGAGVWSRYLICETALPGRRVPTSLVGSEPCSWRELCGSEEAARGSAAQVGGALGASPLSIPKRQATGLGAEKPSPRPLPRSCLCSGCLEHPPRVPLNMPRQAQWPLSAGAGSAHLENVH